MFDNLSDIKVYQGTVHRKLLEGFYRNETLIDMSCVFDNVRNYSIVFPNVVRRHDYFLICQFTYFSEPSEIELIIG